MATSSVLLLCILVICSGRLQSHSNVTFPLYLLYLSDFWLIFSSVWTVQARHLNVRTDDDEEDQVELSVEAGRVCDYNDLSLLFSYIYL